MKDTHGGNVWQVEREYGYGLSEIIDFSASINPLGLPPQIKYLIKKNINNLIHYPDPENTILLEKLADYHCCNSRYVIAGNGSTELIYHLLRAISPQKVFIPAPFFSEYEKAAAVNGVKTVFIPTQANNFFKPCLSDIEKVFKNHSGELSESILILGNPGSPAGAIFSEDDLQAIVMLCKRNKILLVMDEVFLDFCAGADKLSLIPKIGRYKNIAIIRSLTKIMAIPGLRLGYMITSPRLVKLMQNIQPPWSVNYFAQTVTAGLIEDKSYFLKTAKYISRERYFLEKELSKIESLSIFPSAANFFLVAINTKTISVSALKKKLLEKKILIRDLGNMRGLNKKYFRVAVKKRADNILLINSLKECLADAG